MKKAYERLPYGIKPFMRPLPHEERVKRLSAAIEEHPKCAISGSLCGWGDVFIPRCDLVVLFCKWDM